MSRLMLVPSLLCAAVLLSACQTTAPSQQAATPSGASAAPATQAQAAPVVEFRLAQMQTAQNLAELRLADGSVWVLPQPVFSRQDLTGVAPIKNNQGQAMVSFTFNAAGAQRLAAITQQNVGHLLALSINGDLAAISRMGEPVTQGVLNIPVASEQQAINISNAVVGTKVASQP